ncbi:hypothetical protein [uncultured Vagococcus sp.]|uniref:hypothetical protein n=1 Tax=uncultured Vagococcus sp. TaxID=189676 RepID=UPI0025842314|nr:hypothetical protein [uncultured Vagococcus sp.]
MSKFIAYYKGKKINAYQGLKLKTKRIIETRSVEEAELFDSLNENDRYPVRPFKARLDKGNPYFAYYPDNTPKNIINNKDGVNKTLSHDVFQLIFSNLSEFLVHLRYTPEEDKILLKINKSYSDYRVTIKGMEKSKTYMVDVLLDLESTYPYSHYYKWNGFLSLEISVSTLEEAGKVSDLSAQGLQVCELRVPNKVKDELKVMSKNMLDEESSISIFKNAYKKYYHLFESKKFTAYLIELGEIYTKNEWKEKYIEMDKFEQQVKEMKTIIKKKQEEVSQLNDEIEKRNHYLNDLKEEKITFDEQMAKDERNINNLREELRKESSKLDSEKKNINEITKENQKLKEKNESLENMSLFDFLFKRHKSN